MLNDEVLRVLEPGGTIEIVGQAKNGTVNQAIIKAEQLGFTVTREPAVNIGYISTDGKPLTQNFFRYILMRGN